MTNPHQKLPFADKKFGQHFLNNEHIIHTICLDAKKYSPEAIIEVGPGPGILTRKIVELYPELTKNFIHVFEMDARFKEILESILPKEQIHWGDGTKVDWNDFTQNFPKLTSSPPPERFSLISNLPYNVSVPLFINFLECRNIQHLTLMFQKEVAQKIYNPHQKKNFMGSLMALSQTYFDVSHVIDAPPGAFIPPPKVQSTVLSFVRKKHPKMHSNN